MSTLRWSFAVASRSLRFGPLEAWHLPIAHSVSASEMAPEGDAWRILRDSNWYSRFGQVMLAGSLHTEWLYVSVPQLPAQ